MSDTNALVTIDYIIKSYLNWKGISSVADYDRYKQILIEGFTDLNIFHTTYYRTYIGTVNSVNQMLLPSDFIDWLSIAIGLDGEFWEIDVNENLITEPDNSASTPVFSSHQNINGYIGYRYTSVRRNLAGSCKVDYNQRVIVFKGDFKGKDVYLSYSSSGIPTSGNAYVPRELVTVLRTYLDWMLKEADDTVPMSVTMKAEQQHGRALLLYYDNKEQVSGKELINLFRNSIQQGIKR